MKISSGISVIICCYNSVSRIKPTLEHLAKQIHSKNILWEVILVDNNSNDNTSLYAQNIWDSFDSKIDLKIVSEPKPGLSYARDCGVKIATYEYILFCDDDNWFAMDYLERGYSILENNPSIGILGGRGEIVSDVDIPFWFHTYQQDYAVGIQSFLSGNITERGFVWGAGMFLRKSTYTLIKKSNIQSKLTDRKGKSLSSGGDTEICQWFIWAGFQLWYDENMVFKHFLPQERLSKSYYTQLKSAQIKSYDVIRRYKQITNYYFNNSLKQHKIKLFIRNFIPFMIGITSIDRRIKLQISNIFPFITFDSMTSNLIADYKKISKSFTNE